MHISGRGQIVSWNGKKLYYTDQGMGVPVVLIHGYLESREIWSNFAGEMSRYCRVICPDLPGHGDSDVFGEVHSMEFLADSVLAILDHAGIQKTVMAGHSLGGYVSLAFLDRYPERLWGFSLFHSHPLPDSGQTILKRIKEMELIDAGRKDLIYNVNIPNAFASENLEKCRDEIEQAKHIAANTPDCGIKAMLRGMMERPDRRAILQSTALPFLWILGRYDHYISYTEIQKYVTLPAHSQLITLDHSGHQGFMEEPEKSISSLRDFMRRIASP